MGHQPTPERKFCMSIDGKLLRDAIISGANNINHLKTKVDELNVFPVPDGDTGTNMSMTLSAAAKELARLANPTAAEAAKTAASAMLRGARGNSGVILSLLFRGFSKGLAGCEVATGKDLANALDLGVKAAYKAVMKPTEGTILTVARVAAEQAVVFAEANDDPVAVWAEICRVAEDTLNQTPEMLPVLKKAGVVDAGGRGLVVIFEGMRSVIEGNGMLTFGDTAATGNAPAAPKSAAAASQEEIHFTYCTEFIVDKENDKDPLALRAYLESIGDCVVVVDDEDIIKVHVHTNNPGNALQEGLKFGSLTNMKIENMKLQHTEAGIADVAKQQMEQAQGQWEYAPVDPQTPYGFVSVAAGDGLHALFTDLGVTHVVSGGQTMNPSTEDILSAIQATPAKCVFVLPNNKNIIMAAEQAINLADRKVVVLHTKTVPQGISAMLAFNPDADLDTNRIEMTTAYDRVQTGSITFAARDADFDGFRIKQGQLMALANGKVSFVDKDLIKATAKLAKQIAKKDSSFFTLILGEDVNEETGQALEAAVREKLPNLEITVIQGNQPVYYVIMSAE